MQRMPTDPRAADLRGISVPVPGLLHTAGPECLPEQAPRGRDAGGHCPLQGCTWPGHDLGVRAPYPGEATLSWPEVIEAQRMGLL